MREIIFSYIKTVFLLLVFGFRIAICEASDYKEEFYRVITDEVKTDNQSFIIVVLSIIIVLLIVVFLLWHLFYLKKIRQINRYILRTSELKAYMYDGLFESLKSPVTVMGGLIEDLRKNIDKGATAKNITDIDIIEKQSKQINNIFKELRQITEFDQNTKVKPVNRNIIQFLEFLFTSFSDNIKYKDVTFYFFSDIGELNMDFYMRGLRLAVYSIMDLVIKSSMHGDKILMNVRYINKEDTCKIDIVHQSDNVLLEVIPNQLKEFISKLESKKEKAESSKTFNVISQLVDDMGGTLSFCNKKSKELCFSLSLPSNNGIDKIAAKNEFVEKTIALKHNIENTVYKEYYEKDSKSPTILIVDDNQFMLSYIYTILKNNYNIRTCKSAVEALNYLKESIPDLIITDLMMPKIDGNQLSMALKKSLFAGHIPMIMITEQYSDDTRIEAIRAGIDAFLVKPFIEEELIALVHHLLSSREGIMQKISEMLVEKQKIQGGKLENEDVIFIQKISEIIYQELLNTDLSPQLIADKMYVSISYLNRKVKSITNLSTTGYILNIRLNRAKRLLVSSKKQIGDISMECGFNDFAYFSRAFKKEFGITPSQYQRMAIL